MTRRSLATILARKYPVRRFSEPEWRSQFGIRTQRAIRRTHFAYALAQHIAAQIGR
jgi:hypothetical protein